MMIELLKAIGLFVVVVMKIAHKIRNLNECFSTSTSVS